MNTGTVKFFNAEKGFGFITDSSTGKDYFIHSSNLVDQIKQGDAVMFDTREGRKGEEAYNVKKGS